MSDTPDSIWEGDKLRRREEAQLLERFLDGEARMLADMGREQAFVLALDAQYGEGKTWFLERLRRQLAINHPVAFVDAWVDDANNEPLVSIMAALEDALMPFLKKKGVKQKLGALTRAAFPIMGKAALGAGGRLASRYLGDAIGAEASEAVAKAGKARVPASKDGDSPMEAAVDAIVDGVSEVVDGAGKAMLAQYRARQGSREAFKSNLRQLAASIERTDEDRRHSPIFVIVDELDRCRPSYAISLLEEIKHLFDVPGVVFIIALHQEQLEASVKAVYGAEFEARSYLRRFFTRHYGLRRLSITELVSSYFADLPKNVVFSSPPTWDGNNISPIPPDKLAGGLLSEWGVTPREARSVVDALRVFSMLWNYDGVPIDLPLVLVLILGLIRGDARSRFSIPKSVYPGEVEFVEYSQGSGNNPSRVSLGQTELIYNYASANNLVYLTSMSGDSAGDYLSRISQNELNRIHNGRNTLGSDVMLTWSEYPRRVQELGRFLDAEDDQSK